MPPSPPSPIFTFTAADGRAFTVDAAAAATPRGRAARLEQAALLALPTVLALREESIAQAEEGATPPVMLVASPDATLGADVITKAHGAALARQLCGPLVFALAPSSLVALAGAAGPKVQAELGALEAVVPGAPILCFAVNGAALELRAVVAKAPPVVPSLPDPQPAAAEV